MRFLQALISALVAFLLVVVLAIASSYLRCLIAGIAYNFSVAIPIATRVGAFTGGAIFILTLIGPRRRRPPA
jgi:peptidoglycan/LPS O-acetylase OafA/YrhL